MIRLATVNDYPAVSDLLNTHPSFSARPKEFMTMLLSASSKISFMFSTKIIVVEDSRKRIVGCAILNEEPYFLRAETVCIAENVNWRLVLKHVIEFLDRYALNHGYSGYSLTVSKEEQAIYLRELNPSFNFIDYHRGIVDLRNASLDNVQRLTPISVAEFNIQRQQLAAFADDEFKLPIFLATQDYGTFKGVMDRCQGIPGESITAHSDDYLKLKKFLEHNTDSSRYLTESLYEKLVIVDKGRAIGYAFFRTTDRHSKCIEVADIFVLPQYVTTTAPTRLLLAVGRYAAINGARFMCGKCIDGPGNNSIKSFFEDIGMVPDEFTSVFIFDNSEETDLEVTKEEKELTFPDSCKTSVFSG